MVLNAWCLETTAVWCGCVQMALEAWAAWLFGGGGDGDHRHLFAGVELLITGDLGVLLFR